MFFWPVIINTIETLSDSVKDIIAKEVAEAVYKELKKDKYLENAYIFEIANIIAKKTLRFEFARLPNSDAYSIKFLKV